MMIQTPTLSRMAVPLLRAIRATRPSFPAIVIRANSTTSSSKPPRATLPEFDLTNKVIIVTGGRRGLGLCQTRALLESGAKVHAVDLAPSPSPDFESLASHARTALSTSLHYHSCDVCDELKLRQTVASIASSSARLDGLIAAAGINEEVPALDYTAHDFDKLLSINVTGVFLAAQAVAREMVSLKDAHGIANGGRGGSLLLIASMSATVANRGLICSAYNSSKAAVQQMGRNLAAEWGALGIRVNTLSPGYIVTDMVEMLFERQPERRRVWAEQNMLGRLSRPEDYRAAAVFLLGDGSGFCTGSDFIVDGGHTAW